ncbi:hypothetical protein NtRootA4_39230 [Arthrobacter sp. NtRootA4]|nr:hypothetical protein NtRootA4_39230 [Arthrobacter sp. NtRootA4]BCW29705.1 hypothetical protein NtRootD5_00360 [Arthrobacter sp. NtRootD5]
MTARPFASLVPDKLGKVLDLIEGLLRGQHGEGWQKHLVLRLLAMQAERSVVRGNDDPALEEANNVIPA